MMLLHDRQFLILLALLLGVLSFSSLAGIVLARRVRTEKGKETVTNLNARIKAWWAMTAVFLLSIAVGPIGSVVLFALLSFMALREYFALSPTLRADHRVLLWLVFVILPVNYGLVAVQWYGLFAVFIPVYAFIGLQIRAALTGSTEQFLDRTARTQWGMMVAVYFVSYVPAILMMQIPGYSDGGQNFKLLLFLVVVAQASDVLQYVVGKLAGRHAIAPNVSPNKTVEGFVGGVALASLLGAGLYWITPFTLLQAGLLALVICLMGFAGGLVMSATKRDRGVKDFGALLPGHGGILDRIDSICFAAPIFFHLTRYFFSAA
jgi:phosphatidate cytidylyltransferase